MPVRSVPMLAPVQHFLLKMLSVNFCGWIAVSRFQVLSTSGGAAGLTLTVASTAFILEPSL